MRTKIIVADKLAWAGNLSAVAGYAWIRLDADRLDADIPDGWQLATTSQGVGLDLTDPDEPIQEIHLTLVADQPPGLDPGDVETSDMLLCKNCGQPSQTHVVTDGLYHCPDTGSTDE